MGQNQLNDDTISKLSRDQLVAYVTLLRSISGQTTTVKTLIAGFDYQNALVISVATDNENATDSPITTCAPSNTFPANTDRQFNTELSNNTPTTAMDANTMLHFIYASNASKRATG